MTKHSFNGADADSIEGPCVVCGAPVTYIVPRERAEPVLLHHATCDPMAVLRTRISAAPSPLLPDNASLRLEKQKRTTG